MVKQYEFAQVIELWKIEKKQYVKKSTYSAYVLLIENHINPFFGKLLTIEENNVQDFVLSKLEEGLCQKTIKDILIVLKMILKYGYKNKYLPYSEYEIKFPTDRENNDLEVLSITNQKKIMSYIESNFTFKNLGILICLSTGMRIGEICALTWNDADADNGIIRVRKTLQRIYIIDGDERYTELLIDTPKTKNSIRDIPMSSDLLKILKPLKKIANSNYFVITNEEKPTEPRTYRNYYKRFMKKVGIPDLKFHGLRHSFATRCIESNCDYKTVSVILGHSNISTTLNLYVHPNLEQKKKCIQQMLKKLK